MRTRTTVSILGSALVLALAACGTTTPAATTAPAEATVSGSASPAAQESSAGRTDCAADTTSTATGPVTLTDSFGRTVELAQPAQRVAVLEWQQVEDTLSLCVTPVAVADVAGYTLWDTAEALPAGVADVGTRGEPNLDALFATDPDLVIVEAYTADDEIIGQLAAYGVPVLATKGADAADPIGQMRATFELIAQATGRQQRAQVVVDEFSAALAQAKTAVAGTDAAGQKFVYFDGWVQGGNVSIRPFGQGSLVGELGEELGLVNAWTGEVDPAYGLGQTDIEGMVAVGDGLLFSTGTKDPDSDVMAELAKNPIWTSLPAVSGGRASAFPGGIWTFGGPRSAQQVLDAYVAQLAG
ncbi:iron-siderophore ABC transporter substrate-binding protein [Nakamurella sp.]|uniref:iron-siderophore ABC transporter substrate-binding protein n=1 Tax=Nakamurella sp. TaxID=1869182 RepID=UPI003B3A8059